MAPEIPAPRLGKYELVARIATGGMAEIFLAHQPGPAGFSRLVVIKRILPHLAEQPEFLRMFLDEARLASQIHHQNVVQIFDVGQDGDHFFIAMEYVDGVSLAALARRARKHGRLVPYEIAAEIIAQACDGLHAAHELAGEDGVSLGVVHRDVSPQNLMLARTGAIKLVDFGIAKARGSGVRTRTGALKGKFPYMSPEQCRGERVDRRSDLFSLASVFVEILTGRRLFDRASELLTLKAIAEERIPAAHELCRDVPEVVSEVIGRAHAQDRDGRFATAAEMGAAVRAALAGLGQPTTPATLASYLHSDCGDLLDARKTSLTTIDQLVITSSSPVPRLEGFEEATDSSLEGDIWEATRPDKVATETPARANDAAPPPAVRRSSRRWIAIVLAIVAVLVVAAAAGAWIVLGPEAAPPGPRGAPLTFGCPPYYAPAKVEAGLMPLVRYLETKVGRPVKLVVSADYDGLREAVVAGEVDFANMSPLLFVRTRKQSPSLQVLAAHTYEGARTYQSIVVARSDSGIDSLAALEGKSFCYVDHASTSGYLLPRHALRLAGKNPDTFFSATRMSGTHVKVMEDIVAGRCDAGAVFSGALLAAQELGVPTSRIQLVGTTGQTPWDVIVAAPGLDPATAASVKRALLAFDPVRDIGRPIVSNTFRIDGFVEVELRDFEPIEQAAEAEGLLE